MQKNYIKELCKEKKVRQTELALILGMREDSFSIALKRNTLSIAKLEKIASALDVPLWRLFASYEDLAPDPAPVFVCPHCGKKIAIEIKKVE